MQNKTVLITGGTNGIGRVTALELARLGATTVIVSRSAEKVSATVAEIQSRTGNPNVHGIAADLSLMSEVRRAADEFRSRFSALHVLVNNAGAVYDKRQETRDGLELTFALNHMSYFIMTLNLLDLLKASGTPQHKARVVSVSSGAHMMSSGKLDDLQRKGKYSSFGAYGDSKLLNILFTYELAHRLSAEGAPVTANVLHPGGVATGFGTNTSGFMGFLWKNVFSRIMRTPEQGAETSIYLAASLDVENVNGKYFADKRELRSSGVSYDRALQQRIWNESLHIAASVLPTSVA